MHGLSIERVAHPVIFEFNSAAARLRAQGRKVFNLGQAVPDLVPPAELMRQALADTGKLNTYTPDEGFPALRRAVCDKILTPDDAVYNPDTEIIITAGANHAYLLAACAVTDPGDEVILFTPGYFNHAMTLEMLHRAIIEVPLKETDIWELDIDALRAAITPRTRAITLVNPNNPTGAVFSRQSVEVVAQICAERGLWLISDEVYDRYSFTAPHFRPASKYRESTITIGSFSKNLGLMGWRTGFIAAPERVIKQAIKVQDTTVVCAPNAGQAAAELLIERGAWPSAAYLDSIKQRRDILKAEIARIPRIQWREPQGAMFAAVRMDSPYSAHDTALRLLDEKGVITIPCEAFGRGGENHLRLSFGFLPPDEIRAACLLMADFFKNLD